jgi:uncharacterized protein
MQLMTHAAEPHIISTLEQLNGLYDQVAEASIAKELPVIHPHYQTLIEASPFAVLATVGADALDVSPRGDPPGFVHVQDPTTLLLPERRGNNRADSLRNILGDPRVALLFLIPGVGETLRVNGRASISIEPALLQKFAVDDKLPKCVLIIKVETVFFQCARAIQRSKLWQPVTQENKPAVPSAGTMLAAFSNEKIDGEKYDRELPARQLSTLY